MRQGKQQGFGLVEIMVALTLGLMLSAALVRLLLDAREGFTFNMNSSQVQDNGRFALDMISQDLRRAGFLGLSNRARNPGVSITGTLGQAASATTCSADSSWVRMIGQPLFGLDDSIAGYGCIAATGASNGYLRGDVLVTRYAEAQSMAANGVPLGTAHDNDTVYLRTAMMEGRIFSGADADDVDNLVTETPNSDHALVAHAYYVGDSGRSCSGEAVPALFREIPGNGGAPRAEELVSGVEHLQLQYRIGAPDFRYVNAGDVTNWSDVDAVQIWLLVRADCREAGYTDTLGYDLPNGTYQPNDGYRRRLYHRVIALRNFL